MNCLKLIQLILILNCVIRVASIKDDPLLVGLTKPSKINFEEVGNKISNIISINVPYGSQRVGIVMLSKEANVKESATKVIKSVSTGINGQLRLVLLRTAPFYKRQKVSRAKATFNLVITDNLDLHSFFPFLNRESPFRIFYPKVETLILVIEHVPIRMQLLKVVFNQLLQNSLLNVIIAHINMESGSIRTFNHFPYSVSSKIKEYDLLTKQFVGADFNRDSNLNGHLINLVQYDDPPKTLAVPTDPLRGYEGMLMRVVMDKINATPNVIRLPCSDQFVKLSTLQLTNGSGELTVNTQFILSGIYDNSSIDFLYPQILDSYNLLVHVKTNNRWNYMSVFKPFQFEIWAALFVVLMLVTFIWYIIRAWVFKKNCKFADIAMSVGGLLTQPIQSNAERCLFTAYIMFIFIIMNGYQTVLISIMTSPETNSHMTLPEINATSDVEIVMPAKYELSKEFIEKYLQNIVNNKFKVVRMNFWDLGEIERNENHVYLVHVRDGGHFSSTVANRDQNGQLMFKMLPEGLWYSMDTYAMKKNFVLEKRITTLVEGIRQAKLLDRYIPEALFEARQLGILSREQKDGSNKPKVVTFESLKSAFAVLLVGYLISILAFIYEVRNPIES